jgi:hypothetical protein
MIALLASATRHDDCFKKPLRPLPVALAHVMGNTPLAKIGYHMVLNRLYSGLSPADKITCRGELDMVRRAKRGQVEAQVMVRRSP